MDCRSSLLFTLLFCVYTLNVYAAIEPYCKGKSLQNEYDFLENLPVGYKIPQPERSEDLAETVEVIKKNTLCGIQTICLSIMRITEVKNPSEADIHTLIPRINSFYGIPHDMMAILYNINVVYANTVLYPIWLLYLYVDDIFSYWNHFDSVKMTKVHEMITDLLMTSKEADCPGHNEFDVTDQESSLYSDFRSFIDLRTSDPGQSANLFLNMYKQLNQHFDAIRQTLIKVIGENYFLFDISNLFFNTEAVKRSFQMWDYYEFYGKNIQWGDATTKLLDAYKEAKRPTNLYDGLEGIKNFQQVYVTQMKIIKLRLIWTHLLLVTDENRTELNAKMYETADSFTIVTGLKDDEAFVATVNFLNVKNPSPEDSQKAIEDIKSQLTQSCLLFTGCDATNVIGEDVSQIFDEVSKYIDKYDYFLSIKNVEREYRDEARKPLTDPSDIQKNLKLAVLFLKHAKLLLRQVDMDFVKSVLALAYRIP